jgi:hypothetical protein
VARLDARPVVPACENWVKKTALSIDDGNVLATLRALLSAQAGRASSEVLQSINCGALSRLDYPTLQSLMALKLSKDLKVEFCNHDHLKAQLVRYGMGDSFFDDRETQR